MALKWVGETVSVIYLLVQCWEFMVTQKETQPRGGAYVTSLFCFCFIIEDFLDAFSLGMSSSESQRVALMLVLFVTVPLPRFQQFPAGVMRKFLVADSTGVEQKNL